MSLVSFLTSSRRLATLVAAGLLLMLVGVVATRGPATRDARSPVYLSRASGQAEQPGATDEQRFGDVGISGPYVSTAAPASFDGDVRRIQSVRPVVQAVRPELEANQNERATRVVLPDAALQPASGPAAPSQTIPGPLQSFPGLDLTNHGAGWPPDTNGDAGPVYYVQVVNTSVGIYTKTTGLQAAAFTFNALWAGAGSNTPCDSHNNGDPVVLYDAQADRWLVADFAWTDVDNGPYYECLAASKTGDPVAGGWWLYALRADDDAHKWLSDYPKLGVWPDGLYMSANMFDCSNQCAIAPYQGARVWALNRTDLYSGAQPLHAVFFDAGASYFGLLPSNFRGAQPPAGAPNYFVSNDQAVYALDVFKFHVDWTNPSNSTFGLATQVKEAPYASPPASIAVPLGNALDSLGDRLMMQNQYRNLTSAESLWIAHTADNPPAIRWYQLDVTGGSVANAPVQQSTYAPDTRNRWMPSLAVDKFGNMAVGYTTSSSQQFPDIRYAGRLAGDPANTLGQDENTLVYGGGTQTNTCGGGPCGRWGDYSSMTVDPLDDCTFWYTTEYYAASGGDWQTRIGSFRFPVCGPVPPPLKPQIYFPAIAMNGSNGPGGWTTMMQETFEASWPGAGWQVLDPGFGEYLWAKRNCRAHAGSSSAWAMGGGSLGVQQGCGAAYINNAFSWMIYGPFSLVGATAADFQAQLWLNTEYGYDSTCLMASTDDFNTTGAGTCFTGSTGGSFVPETLPLNAAGSLGNLLGKPQVWVAIIFRSDASVTYPEGAYVDDLLLRKCADGTCTGAVSGQASALPDAQLHQYSATLARSGNTPTPPQHP